MAGMFLNRREELKSLTSLWQSSEGRLVLVWGRRRVGKSYLLSHFGRDKVTVHYTATERAPQLELASFSQEVSSVLKPGPRDVLSGGPFRTWDEALRYLGEAAATRPILCVLDEFSYLIEGDPSLPSVLQRFWDQAGRSSKLRLVLCGSATTVMEGLGAQRAPLFGRFDARMQIRPFSYYDSAAFHPRLAPADQALVFGILGGMPIYLKQWDDEASVDENILRLFADPASTFIDEGELLLRSEMPEAAGYFRMMSAVAAGRTKFSEIANEAGMDPTRSLEKLVRVGLLERVAPVTENPDRTKRRRYRISDNFLLFWFRFIYPNRGQILGPAGATVIKKLVLPHLDDHMGPVFEDICRQFVVRAGGRRGLPETTKVGPWWSTDAQTEIDVVGLDGKRPVLAGEVKWSKQADRRDLRSLQDKVARLPQAANSKLAMFAREQFTGLSPKDALLFTAKDLYLKAPG